MYNNFADFRYINVEKENDIMYNEMGAIEFSNKMEGILWE